MAAGAFFTLNPRWKPLTKVEAIFSEGLLISLSVRVTCICKLTSLVIEAESSQGPIVITTVQTSLL